jgi:hypothetical protein
MQSCFPSRYMVSTIGQSFYLMGAWDPLLPPLGPSDLESPFESGPVVCRSSSPHACDSSLIHSAIPGQNLHLQMDYG